MQNKFTFSPNHSITTPACVADVSWHDAWARVLVVTLVAGCTLIIHANNASAQSNGSESVAVVAPTDADTRSPAANRNASISTDALGADTSDADAPSSDSSSAPPNSPAPALSDSQSKTSPSSVLIPRTAAEIEADEENVQPWDFSPYKMLVWVVSDDPRIDAATIDAPLRAYLDRHYSSIWRVTIGDAPSAVGSAAARDLSALDFDSISASDPVIAVKRNHNDALRIRVAGNIDEYVSKVYGTAGMIDAVTRRGELIGDKTIHGAAQKFEAIDGDALALQELWKDEKTEALLVPRALATGLDEPEAKLVDLPVADLVSTAIDRFDKIFIVVVKSDQLPRRVSVVAFETLMHYFGDVVQEVSVTDSDMPDAIGRALSDAFLPELRIDDAGLKGAQGLIRAGGLILDEESSALVKEGDVLLPLVRKNDRNGRPILIGPLDWAYLLATEIDGPRVKMEFYSGRPGGLQGRQNKRTFRRALRIRARETETMIRLHAKGKPDHPLIGYEIYEKELYSTKMTFIGRTDWNGRLNVTTTEDPMRLFYVKNGGAVLARLPIVPGLTEHQVADLTGDDMRLQAEAYVNGVANAIVDLVAIRKLLGARIRNRLKKGQMKEAEELLLALREQPTKEILSGDMEKKQAYFLAAVGTRNANGRKKVDNMFTSTREMLDKQITQKFIREIEEDFIRAKSNGGKLPDDPEEEEQYDASANEVPTEEPKK